MFGKIIEIKDFYEHMSQKYQLPKSSCKIIIKEMERKGLAEVKWRDSRGARLILKNDITHVGIKKQ